jgi:cell division transport system ATP-binding protein
MVIKFDDVTKKFGSHVAISDLFLEIQGGEFVFLVGPSGAGKSTILRLLAREYPPSSGKIFLDDIDITKLKGKQILDYRRKIGYVFQDFKLIADRTVFENVALSLEVRDIGDDEIEKEVERILKLFEIWDRRYQFPAELSGGEAQRTAIARAIIAKPDLLLADEPTGDLDPQTAWGVIQLLNEINSWGTTIVMATHNVEIVNSLKKRVINVKNGKVIKDTKEGGYSLH